MSRLHTFAERNGMNYRQNNGPMYALVGLILALTVVVAVVTVFGKTDESVKTVIQFVGTTVPMVLGYVFLNGRINSVDTKVDDNTSTTETIAQNVNGKLDERLNKHDEMLSKIHDAITKKDDGNATGEQGS